MTPTTLRRLVFAHDTWFVRVTDGRIYSDRGAFPWERYLAISERLTVVCRMRALAEGETTAAMALVSHPRVDFTSMPNLATLRGRFVVRRQAAKRLRAILEGADGVVARLPSEIGGLAGLLASRMGVPWVAELVTCPWDAIWNYGTLKGRVFAPVAWIETRRLLRRAPYALYVTERFLQHRYPTRGTAAAVSDVDITSAPDAVVEARMRRISAAPRPLVFGTVAALLPYKGIDTALAALAAAGDDLPAWRYRILGSGNAAQLQARAASLGIADRVEFDGTLPAGPAVHRWLDEIDVYLQPSRQEGLPRAVVEAMSRGCPVVASSAGGIPELIPAASLHPPGDVQGLRNLLIRASGPSWQAAESRRNRERAADYRPQVLDDARRRFWQSFARAADGQAPRVLFVTPYAQRGGSERQLLMMLDGIGRHSVAGVVALQRGPLLEALPRATVIETSARATSLLRSVVRLRTVIRSTRPGVVHAACVKGALVAGAAAIGLGVPVVFVDHDFYWRGPVAWTAALLASKVVAVSEALARTYPRPLSRRVTVVCPGVDLTPVDADGGKSRVRALTGAVRVAAVVGRLHPDKGQQDAIEALAEVPDVHLLIVGAPDRTTPNAAAQLRACVEHLGLSGRVTFAGEQDDVPSLLAGCALTIVPTRVPEGFGIVAVEAMAADVPVVAYAHGAVSTVVGDAGLLVRPGDVAELASAIRAVTTSPALAAQLASRGRSKVSEFSLDEYRRGMCAIYAEVGTRRGPRRVRG